MTRRKDGTWQEAIKLKGMSKYKYFYGKTKSEVLRKIAEFTEEYEKGAKFVDVADEWWEIHEPTLEYNTTKSYRPALKRAKIYFANTYIRQIKPHNINKFLYQFITQNHAAQKTAKTQLMVVNLICKYATACGYIDNNPARDISVPRNLPKNRREMPSDDDIKRVKDSTNCTFGMFAYWILYTGCRRGELLALDWSDINFDDRSITISKSVYHMNNKPYLKKPKSSAGTRIIPLMSRLALKISPKKGPIFPGPNGGLMSEMQFQKLWNQYITESGVTCTPHQLRHAYATMLFENDISESDAQELLGHAYISTTKDIYTHIRETRKAQVRNKLIDVDIA